MGRIRKMMKTMFNEGGLTANKDGEFKYNHQDVSLEVDWIRTSYVKNDFKRMGFILGRTMDKHLEDDKKVSNSHKNLFLY